MISAALAVLEKEEQRNELSEFYEKNKNRFYAVAYKYLHNKEEAEDAVQEAFLRIANKPDKLFSLNYDKQVFYVCAVVRNVSIDMFNKRRKNNAVSLEDVDDNIMSDTFSPEEKYITDTSVDELVQFALTLPESWRQALFMYVHQKLSYPEISKILGISEELARKRVSNARKAIKNFAEGKK